MADFHLLQARIVHIVIIVYSFLNWHFHSLTTSHMLRSHYIVYLNKSLSESMCWNVLGFAWEPLFLPNPHWDHSGKCLVNAQSWHVVIDKRCTPEPQQTQKTPKVISSSLGQLYNWAGGHREDMERDNEAIELQFVAGQWVPPVGHCCKARRPFKEFKVHLRERLQSCSLSLLECVSLPASHQ